MARKSVAQDSPRMPSRYFALLCEVVKGLAVDPDAVLRAANIAPEQIAGPEAGLTVPQAESLIRESLAATRRPDLGLLVGRQIKLSNHEILGYGILTSPTLDYAISLASRYYRLITPWFRMDYRRGRRQSEVTFQPVVQLAPEALTFMIEMVVVSAHEQLKSLAQGRMSPYELFVSYPEPPYVKAYDVLRPARFHFGAERLPGGRFVLDNDVLAHPLPMADRATLKMAEERCEELLRRTTQQAGMTEWVTMMLRESHHGAPNLSELAHLLNQSPRTLDRHLNREGTRFLALSKRIRHQRACDLLKSGMSATQVAYHVGYGELANFSRAFRREAGMTPRQYARS